MSWEAGADVGRLARQPVRLRIERKDADLFALRFRQMVERGIATDVFPAGQLTSPMRSHGASSDWGGGWLVTSSIRYSAWEV